MYSRLCRLMDIAWKQRQTSKPLKNTCPHFHPVWTTSPAHYHSTLTGLSEDAESADVAGTFGEHPEVVHAPSAGLGGSGAFTPSPLPVHRVSSWAGLIQRATSGMGTGSRFLRQQQATLAIGPSALTAAAVREPTGREPPWTGERTDADSDSGRQRPVGPPSPPSGASWPG